MSVNRLQANDGQRDKLIELLREFSVWMHAEPGCIHYSMHKEVDDENSAIGARRLLVDLSGPGTTPGGALLIGAACASGTLTAAYGCRTGSTHAVARAELAEPRDPVLRAAPARHPRGRHRLAGPPRLARHPSDRAITAPTHRLNEWRSLFT